MNREPMRCNRCHYNTLKYVCTTADEPYIETWECSCGHTECFHVTTSHEINDAVNSVQRDDFDTWIKKMGGLDFIDDLGKVEAMRIAFLAGIQAQQDTEIARLDAEIAKKAERCDELMMLQDQIG